MQQPALRALFAVLALCLFPAAASAATIGFSGEPVWISSTPVIEGDAVLIHAALTNGSSETLTGTLVFRAEGNLIGSVPIELKRNEARVVSVSWAPKAGTYEVAVELTNPSQEAARRTETLKVTVAQKADEKKSVAGAAAAGFASLSPDPSFTDSSGIQGAILGVSTDVGEVLAPVFNTVDSWRKDGSEFLAKKSAEAKVEVAAIAAKKKALEDEDTSEAKSESRKLTLWQVLRTLLLYIYQAFNMLISKAGIFYPVVALAFLFFLYKGYQKIRRPSYDY